MFIKFDGKHLRLTLKTLFMDDIQEISFPPKPQDESAQQSGGRSIISVLFS